MPGLADPVGRTDEQKEVVEKASQQKNQAKTTQDVREILDAAWIELVKGLGVGKADRKQMAGQSRKMGLVNMFYLLVLVGCELDLYAFVMSWGLYWSMDIVTVRALLVIAPLGYSIAVGLYLYNTFSTLPNDRRRQKPATSISLESREQISLQFYHFCPIVRYYLVVKDKEPDDVEGVLRVNSLSSFSLGVCQLIAITFSRINGEEWNMFMSINVAAQFINWSITFLYFITPICARMKASVRIDALKYNSAERLKQKWIEYLDLAQKPQPAENKAMKKFTNDIDAEILFFGNQIGNPDKASVVTKNDMAIYRMIDKFDALRHLHELQIDQYAKL